MTHVERGGEPLGPGILQDGDYSARLLKETLKTVTRQSALDNTGAICVPAAELELANPSGQTHDLPELQPLILTAQKYLQPYAKRRPGSEVLASKLLAARLSPTRLQERAQNHSGKVEEAGSLRKPCGASGSLRLTALFPCFITPRPLNRVPVPAYLSWYLATPLCPPLGCCGMAVQRPPDCVLSSAMAMPCSQRILSCRRQPLGTFQNLPLLPALLRLGSHVGRGLQGHSLDEGEEQVCRGDRATPSPHLLLTLPESPGPVGRRFPPPPPPPPALTQAPGL